MPTREYSVVNYSNHVQKSILGTTEATVHTIDAPAPRKAEESNKEKATLHCLCDNRSYCYSDA